MMIALRQERRYVPFLLPSHRWKKKTSFAPLLLPPQRKIHTMQLHSPTTSITKVEALFSSPPPAPTLIKETTKQKNQIPKKPSMESMSISGRNNIFGIFEFL